MSPERRWLKVSEAAQYVGSHPRSIRRACASGKIPYAKVPGIGVRIDKRGLDALLTRQDPARK